MDYPIPDPAWDYTGIWHNTQLAKLQIEELLKYLADIEDGTPEEDVLYLIHTFEKVQP